MKFHRGFIVVAFLVSLPFIFGDSNVESGLEPISAKPKYVFDLVDETFGSTIKSDLVLVMFYSQSAKASSVLRSVYANAAKNNKPIHPNAIFASVDVDSQTNVANSLVAELGVTDIKHASLPLFRVYSKGEYIRDYKGQLDTHKITGFLKRLSGPGLVTFSTEAQLETFIRDMDRDSTAVGFFETVESDAARNFREVSKRLKGDMDFAMLTLDSGKLKFPFSTVKQLPSVVVYRNFAPPAFYNTEADPSLANSNSLFDFCIESADNFVEEITKDNIKDEILKKRLPIAIIWVEHGDQHKENYDKYLSIFRQVATKFQKSIAFYWAKGPENFQQMKKFGLDGKTFPSVSILDPKSYLHYSYSNEMSRDGLVTFFTDFLGAKIEPNMKKELPPTENSGPVTTLVYDTFKSLVLDAKHDVVVLFYINDTNCRNVLKFFESIAVALKGSNVELAKINLDLNDTPRHGIHSVITGYPTIKYFSYKSQLAETYKEARVAPKQLLSWVHAQSKSAFDLEAVTSKLGYSTQKAIENPQEILNNAQEIL